MKYFLPLINLVAGSTFPVNFNSAVARNLHNAFSELNSTVIDDVLQHGCICSQLLKIDEINLKKSNLGVPIDAVDEMCREWVEARYCSYTEGECQHARGFIHSLIGEYERAGNVCLEEGCEGEICIIDRFYSRQLKLTLERGFEKIELPSSSCHSLVVPLPTCSKRDPTTFPTGCFTQPGCFTCDSETPDICATCHDGYEMTENVCQRNNTIRTKPNQQISTVQLFENYQISFNIDIHAFTPVNSWRSIIHIGDDNKVRAPAIMFYIGTTSQLYVASTKCSHGRLSKGIEQFSETYPTDWVAGNSYSVRIEVHRNDDTWNRFRVFSDDQLLGAFWGYNGCIGETLPVYAGSPWHETADVEISDFKYEEIDQEDSIFITTIGRNTL